MIMDTNDPAELERLRIEYLGKSGQLAQLARQLKDLPHEEKIEVGKLFNDVKTAISDALENKLKIKNLPAGKAGAKLKITIQNSKF